jgi:DNA-directed RNA polymerase specialized sigma24 family protein
MPQPDQRRARAVGELPAMYAEAIRLRDAGVTNEEIAVRLGIEVVAVRPLLIVAEAKLEAILGRNASE